MLTIGLFFLFTAINILATLFIVKITYKDMKIVQVATHSKLTAFEQIYKSLFAELQKVHVRIDQIFTVDKPSPNEASVETSIPNDLSENDMVTVPKDLKFEVEGDAQVPPGYTEEK